MPDVRARGHGGRAICPGSASTARAHALVDRQGGDPARPGPRQSIRRIPADEEFRDAGRRAGRSDRATIAPRASSRWPSSPRSARTSSTGVDPVGAIAAICEREDDLAARRCRLRGRRWPWCPAGATSFDGTEPRRLARRESAQVALHAVRSERALLPPHGRRPRRPSRCCPSTCARPRAGGVRNLMDTGIQLGRRFRALKLWMVLRYFGAEGIRARLVEHVRLARLFASWVDAHRAWSASRRCRSPSSASAIARRASTTRRRWSG